MGNIVDLVIFLIIGAAVLTGLVRGFIKEAISISVWIIAFWFAFNYGSILNGYLDPYIQNQTIKVVIEFVIIFACIMMIGAVFNLLVGAMLQRSGLSSVDRLLGMCFGFMKGVFLVSVLLVAVNASGFSNNSFFQGSTLIPQFSPIVSWLNGYVPGLIGQVNAVGQSVTNTLQNANLPTLN